MKSVIPQIPMREVLHFLGWRGTPIEPSLISQLQALIHHVSEEIQPRIVTRRFLICDRGFLNGTSFAPLGQDVGAMLSSCHEAVLLAATLGVQSERMLLKTQARSGAEAVLLDAVLSAAIEAVCDREEISLRAALENQKLYLTDRFSPGYGDMPIEQTREICAVLDAERAIGLTVSQSGIMIPRKSVTAIMGISKEPVARRTTGCAVCAMRETCALRKMDKPSDGDESVTAGEDR